MLSRSIRRMAPVLPLFGRARDSRGVALMLTLVLMIALVAMTAGALLLTGTEHQLRTYSKGEVNLRYAAEQGAEMGLSRLNRDETALPDTGFNILESHFTPTDAAGDTIPGVTVNVYAARTGSATGLTGNFASVVGEAVGYGARSLVRLELTEESFAKFAYFSNNEGGNIWFGGGDQLFGPVHSNDQIKVHSSGATFHDVVTTAKTVLYPDNGTFMKGYQENVAVIPMPNVSDLSRLQALATAGGAFFTPPSTGNPDNVQMRIEFLAIDMNGDGDATDPDEGFFRIYRSTDPDWVGAYPGNGGSNGPWVQNCGDFHNHPTTGEPWFISAANHKVLFENAASYTGPNQAEVHAWQAYAPLKHGQSTWNSTYAAVANSPGARCYLGGDPRLTLSTTEFDAWDGTAGDAGWLRRADFMPSATLPAALAGRSDADFLFPLDRQYNPDFRGVIYFDGLVGVSGVLNGRVTLVSSDNMVLVDDFTYSVPANAERCNDIAGFLVAGNFYVADNTLNAPQNFPNGGPWNTLDDTGSEFIDGVILTLNTSFTVENYNSGPTDAQACETTPWGRGCLYLTGGLIQETRGPVGRTNGQGYLKRYAYDSNARFCPPPHFPTTGSYSKNRYYEVNPNAFTDPGSYFAAIR